MITICFGFLLSMESPLLRAQGREFDEYEVKAVFLANFLKFVEWPSRDREAESSYKLCIYGSDHFGSRMGIVEGMKIRGKKLEIRRPTSIRGVNDCNILFISSSERRRIHLLLNAIRGMDVLTVGDTEGYAEQGVMVNFYIEASKVRFEINLNSIRRSKINVSSQLLKLGRVVDHE